MIGSSSCFPTAYRQLSSVSVQSIYSDLILYELVKSFTKFSEFTFYPNSFLWQVLVLSTQVVFWHVCFYFYSSSFLAWLLVLLLKYPKQVLVLSTQVVFVTSTYAFHSSSFLAWLLSLLLKKFFGMTTFASTQVVFWHGYLYFYSSIQNKYLYHHCPCFPLSWLKAAVNRPRRRKWRNWVSSKSVTHIMTQLGQSRVKLQLKARSTPAT